MEEVKILSSALYSLYMAVRELKDLPENLPVVPLPRERKFFFAPGIRWPQVISTGRIYYDSVWSDTYGRSYPLVSSYERANIAREIINKSNQPRSILRALRRIQAATAWCHARAEGRRRQAEEVLRQQSAAVKALEAEAAIVALQE